MYIVFEPTVTFCCYLHKNGHQFTTANKCVYNPRMTTKTPSKNGKFLGRPTKYDPAFCDQVIALGAEGLSRYQICAKLGIGYHNMLVWEDVHEDFRRALDESRVLALAHWEDLGQNHMVETPGGPRLNTGLWSRSMAARFPREYRENSKVEVTGKNDGPIEIDHVHDFSQTLLDDLLAARQGDAESGNS